MNVSEAPQVSAKLEAGATGEHITCKCQISQAATSSTGVLVDSKTITEVPLTTRNFTQILTMSAGSAGNVNNAGVLGAGSQNSNVNGNTAGSNYTVDGAKSATTVPNPDTISEFRIQTSQYDSGYGAWVPNTNLVTRSGENGLHGDVWEFVRNNMFNANDFFLNRQGRPRPDLKQNQFGGTIGGPIKKDKLFFFGSYQGTRQVNGLDNSSLATITLPPLTNDRSAAALGDKFCPAHYGPAANTFAGGVQVACDGSNINPAALRILQLKLSDGSYVIPTPLSIINGASGPLGRSSYSLPSTYREDQVIANIDYVVSKKHSLAGRFYYAPTTMVRALGTNEDYVASMPNVPGFPQTLRNIDYLSSLSLTSVLTNNLANEVRMTFSQSNQRWFGPGVPLSAPLGVTPADPLYPYPPELDFQGPLGSFKTLGKQKNDQWHYPRTYSWADNLSWIHGRHSIRTGVLVLRDGENFFDTDPARGRLKFQNFTDFLLGLSAAQNGSPSGYSNIYSIEANEGAGPRGESVYRYRTQSLAVFVEDDLKLSSRFTLNLGLRWEYIAPWNDLSGQRGNYFPSLLQLMPIPPDSGTYIGLTVPSNYDANAVNPFTGQPFGPPPAGVVVRSNSSIYENTGPLDRFAPRIGFAWQPGSKQSSLAIRGGYGWFYQLPPQRAAGPGEHTRDGQPFGQLFGQTGASNGGSTLDKPFPAVTLGFVPRSPTSSLDDRIYGQQFKVPKLEQWNLNIQYKFSPKLSLDLGYAGSRGTRLLLSNGLNQPLLATPGHPVNCGLPNTAAGLGVTPAKFATLGIDSSGCVTTNTSANAYLRVTLYWRDPNESGRQSVYWGSWYHGMQATLRQQISRGLTFQAAYTFSKAMTNTTPYNDQNTLAWARTSFDRTHRIITNFNYDFPSFLTRGPAGKVLSGWSISGIATVQSGSPLTLMDRKGGSVYGFAGMSTITLCPKAPHTTT